MTMTCPNRSNNRRVLLAIGGVGLFLLIIFLLDRLFVLSRVDPNISAIMAIIAGSFVFWMLIRNPTAMIFEPEERTNIRNNNLAESKIDQNVSILNDKISILNDKISILNDKIFFLCFLLEAISK